jgi:1-deoxyxylulose-5-phosphate synthase
MDYVELGTTGLTVSRLGIGTGTHGWAHHSEQTALGIEGLAALLQRGVELGVNFWDAADQYGSHPHLARALKGVARDKVVIATKTTAKRGAEVTREIDRFLRELNTDAIDIVLLHGLSHADWPKRYASAMDALTRAREVGKVRAVGFSCHGLGALRTAVTNPWPEVILVRINYAGVNMDGKPAEVVPVIEELYAGGKGLYAMKALGCGRLKLDLRRAYQWILDLGVVHALSIGTSSIAELEENAGLVAELAPPRPLQRKDIVNLDERR